MLDIDTTGLAFCPYIVLISLPILPGLFWASSLPRSQLHFWILFVVLFGPFFGTFSHLRTLFGIFWCLLFPFFLLFNFSLVLGNFCLFLGTLWHFQHFFCTCWHFLANSKKNSFFWLFWSLGNFWSFLKFFAVILKRYFCNFCYFLNLRDYYTHDNIVMEAAGQSTKRQY